MAELVELRNAAGEVLPFELITEGQLAEVPWGSVDQGLALGASEPAWSAGPDRGGSATSSPDRGGSATSSPDADPSGPESAISSEVAAAERTFFELDRADPAELSRRPPGPGSVTPRPGWSAWSTGRSSCASGPAPTSARWVGCANSTVWP